jgi:hypothetical protein
MAQDILLNVDSDPGGQDLSEIYGTLPFMNIFSINCRVTAS